MAILAVAMIAACSREKARDAAHEVAAKVHDAFDVSAPLGKPEAPDAAQKREQQRFDAAWRQLQSFGARQAAQTATAPPVQIAFVSGKKETFKGLDAKAINEAPVSVPIAGDVKGPSVLKAQVLLDRLHFSVGVIDGRWGRNSAISAWF
jgi:hypothetical protein